MYGLSDQPNGMPFTRFRAALHGSSRYSARIRESIEHMFVIEATPDGSASDASRLDDDVPPSTCAPSGAAEM